jgi:hypothetical protein
MDRAPNDMTGMEWRHRLLGSAQGMINLLDGIHYPKEGAPQAHNYYVKIVPTVCDPKPSCSTTPHPKSAAAVHWRVEGRSFPSGLVERALSTAGVCAPFWSGGADQPVQLHAPFAGAAL